MGIQSALQKGRRLATVMFVAAPLAPPLPALSQAPASGATATITGTVVDGSDRPVRGATITTEDDPRGVITDNRGGFILRRVVPGERELRALAVGHRAAEVTVTVAAGDSVDVSIALAPDPVAMDALVVTGTMLQTSVSASPVKVEVIPAAVLQRTATNNLTEAIQYVNGLYNQVDCGVCYTNSIRINGMEGPYTAVLIDGMPLMSSLASVYGLNGINPSVIERVEVLKGPSSTLYGSEAMGGVINVITKDPRFAPRLAADFSTTSDLEGNLDVAISSEPGDVSAFLSGNLAYNDRFMDRNGDGFSDFPLNRRGVVFAKADYAPEGRRVAMLSMKYLFEDRFGGVEAWTPSARGSAEVYGESIKTHRAEVLGSYTFGGRVGARFDASYTWHDQDSWYGDSRYDATQHIAFGNLTRAWAAGNHDLLLGLTARLQGYDDNTPATAEPERRFIPGVFAQDEFRITPDLSLLGGARVDHHAAHGAIVSPRLAMKWDAGDHTTLRLNAGTGFRVVNLFTEDHAALTGSREVVVAEALQPERSRSVAININQIVEFGPNPMMIDLDVFHTRFSNRILADYDADPRLIVYDNLRGHSVSRGVSLAANQNVDFDRFLWTVGLTLQDVYTVDDGDREEAFFAPKSRITLGATWQLRRVPLRLDYTGTVTGSMRLPEYAPPFARPTRSPLFSLHNLQGTWRSAPDTELYFGTRNVFDFSQPSPLVAPDDPFGGDFDTAYIYGPMRGRHFLVGIRHGVGR